MTRWTVVPAVLAAFAAPAWADKKLDDAVAKAEEQLQKGKPEEAEKTLQKAASQASCPDGPLAMARLLLKLGKEEEAGQSLQAAAQCSANAAPAARSQALAAQAEFELVSGSGKAALERAQQAVQAEPGARALAALARAQARLGDGTAVQTAEKAIAAGATSVEAHLAKGEALLAARQGAAAEAAFREAARLDPRSAAALTGVARALIEQNKAVDAVTEARKATELDAHSAEAFATLALALLKQDAQKNWNEAIGHAQNGVFENPKSTYSQVAVAQLFEAAGNYTQAMAAYDAALQVDPGLSAARLAKVKAQMRKDPKNAVGEACRVAAESPNSGDVQLMCANALLLAGDYAKAVPYLEKATQLAPGLAEAHIRLAAALFATNQADKAVGPCKRAAELEPNNIDTLTSCGLILGKGGEVEGGIAMIKKVTAQPGYKDPSGWMNLGWLYRSANPPKVDESVAAYRKALELDPKNVQAALGVGWAYIYGERWPDAEAAFLRAAQIDPKVAGEAYFGIARSYYFRTDMAKAKEFAEKAKAEGREVGSLLASIDKYEKAVADNEARKRLIAEQRAEAQRSAASDDGANFPGWLQKMSGGAAAKRAACREGVTFGAQAVPKMIEVLRREADVGARSACVQALGALGSRAKDALPTLEYMIADPPAVNPNPTPEQLKAEMQELDLIRQMKEAVRKIKG